ncbi:MAG TPA: hypothetical protein VJN43_16085 [Bryobacteraceae bacterium]|nr:hypothetical protein [Bryobacteraceae bacterium]
METIRWPLPALALALATALPAIPSSVNLGLTARGAEARSWEPGVPVIAEHEPFKANDGSFHSYWLVRPENLPADLGLAWPAPKKISSLIVRYFNGRMVRGPAVARSQQWARPQYWDSGDWRDLDAQMFGQETSVVRYVFPAVTTTRVRLLFSEPPDPESRRFPDRLPIAVCELEAYEDVLFQIVRSPGRTVKLLQRGDESRDYLRYFNEPPSGDSGYDLSEPLVIEPKQTRIFTDTLSPTLIVADSQWAKTPVEITRPRQQAVTIGNGFLELEISTAPILREIRLSNRVTGESLATPAALAFSIRTATGQLRPENFRVAQVSTAGSTPQQGHVRVELTSEPLDLTVHYELRAEDHFLHKWISLHNKSAASIEVRDVTVSSLGLPRTIDLAAGQELTYPVARMEKGGFFECLETIYWDHKGDALTYYPGVTVAPGAALDTEKAVVGVYRNRGEYWGGWDRGLRDWIIEYHAQISQPPPEWPDVYSEGWSVKVGIEELVERPQWSEHLMATAEKLGIRYMDGFEPAHQAAVAPPDLVERFVSLAGRYHVNTGWWIDFGSDIDWHTGAPLKPVACHLSPEGEAYFQKILALARTYKLRAMHWADFFTVFPCERTDHGHLPGKYSIYAQGQRMLRFGRELREASPGIMLGADGGFTNPQYVRYLDSRAHGTFYGGYEGDHFSSVEPDLHLDRLYADMNRVYLFGSHAVYLRPWYRMLNCVNHYGQESHHHDRAGYRYSLLSALAMAGQVTYNDIPDDIPESEIRFTQHWFDWARRNKDYLRQGDKLFDRSVHFADVWQGDAESLSGFAHIRKDRGYIFLLNSGEVEQIADLALQFDAPASARFIAEEIFPSSFTLKGPSGGEYAHGARLRVTVPAKQVRVIWIAPASASTAPRNLAPEDQNAPAARRYVGDWNIASHSADSATLHATFEFPAAAKPYLANSTPEAEWSREPWAYEKAYLVLLVKDENRELNDNWVSDKLPQLLPIGEPMAVTVNGAPKSLQAFKTIRNQHENVTRCYFVSLDGETHAGASNEVRVTLPIQRGLTFSGAYVDLPDQVPSAQ